MCVGGGRRVDTWLCNGRRVCRAGTGSCLSRTLWGRKRVGLGGWGGGRWRKGGRVWLVRCPCVHAVFMPLVGHVAQVEELLLAEWAIVRRALQSASSCMDGSLVWPMCMQFRPILVHTAVHVGAHDPWRQGVVPSSLFDPSAVRLSIRSPATHGASSS